MFPRSLFLVFRCWIVNCCWSSEAVIFYCSPRPHSESLRGHPFNLFAAKAGGGGSEMGQILSKIFREHETVNMQVYDKDTTAKLFKPEGAPELSRAQY